MILGAIRRYQAGVSPLLGARCRFEPSCSVFAYDAIQIYGVRRGGWLAIKRLARCRPGGGRGYDPVPATGEAPGSDSGPYRARVDSQRVA